MFNFYLRGLIWWVSITYNGKRHRFSTKTTDKARAKEVALDWTVKRGYVKDLHTVTWLQTVERYLSCTQHKSAKERNGDKMKLKWITKRLGNPLLDTLKKSEFLAIIEHKLERQSIATANRYIAVINTLFSKAYHDWGWINSPMKIKTFPETSYSFSWLTREQANKLINVCPTWLAGLITFALETGLRKSNILNLRWANVDMENGICWVNANEAKGKRAIRIPISNAAMKVLRTQKEYEHTRLGYVFDRDKIQKRVWDKYCKLVGIENVRFHDLRHTFASWLAQDGVSLYQIKELLGHSDIKSTVRYSHLMPNTNKLVYSQESALCGYATAY